MKFFTVDQAAMHADVEVNVVYRLLKKGKIYGAFKLGRSWRIPADFMERMSEMTQVRQMAEWEKPREVPPVTVSQATVFNIAPRRKRV